MSKKVELLAPAGNFESLKAAVQSGADAVYFGADKFNARAGSKNFNLDELKNAIEYANLRNVKTHLTLNILIKNNEFQEAMELVHYAYINGIDAIIVQDLGLAKEIIKSYPDLEVHASTQSTIYSLEGVKELEKLGYSRAVLARELNIVEIENICKNSKIDIEVFVHGALCISYSGQCLMSSLVGGRSGNRGKCAGTCRMPYELINKGTNKTEEKGYLLSSKDVCTLDIIPELIAAGVKSFKIEGRMKSPEYVATVTSIYRKYIDLAESGREYIVAESDREKLLQIFNRGGFSTGYLKGKLGRDMMYKDKPNHIGIPIGKVISYNPSKGYVRFKASKEVTLGDSIAINNSSCKISELMKNNQNIKIAGAGEIITVGRIKGRIKPQDKIFKTVSLMQVNEIMHNLSKENIKRKISCNLIAKIGESLVLEVEDNLTGIKVNVLGSIAQKAQNTATKEDRIKEQLIKTGGTVFEIDKINIALDDNIFLSIKDLNALRREALMKLEEEILKTFKRNSVKKTYRFDEDQDENSQENAKVSILLNKINPEYNYENIKNVDNIYLHLSQIVISKNEKAIDKIVKNFNTYIYIPAVVKDTYKKVAQDQIEKLVKYGIKGFVISNLSQLEWVKKYNLLKVANYTMNVFNNQTAIELKKLGFSTITISPELNQEEIKNIKTNLNKEIIAYGRTLLMTSEYCPIGTFKGCTGKCEQGKYVLKDRMGFEFPILTDRINCNSYIYNSKITSIKWEGLNVDCIRLDFIDETIEEMNSIILIHKNGERMEGKDYTNGNLNREV